MMREMKNSGMGWIEAIPANWTVSRIGAVYKLRNTKVSDRDYPPLSVTMRGILPQLETAAKTDAHDDRKLVCKGDFAINSRSDRRGSCGISPFDGSISLINTVLCPLTNMDPGYYNWLFHTDRFADEFYKWGHGIVDDLWTTGWQEMKNILIPMPPLTEQKNISKFLDSECEKIDNVKADIEKQIDALQKYKFSVITEAVTKGINGCKDLKSTDVSWAPKIPSHWRVMPNKYLMKKIKTICSVHQGEDIISLSMNGVIVRDLDAGGKMPTSFNGYQFVYPGNLLMCLFDYDVTPRCIGYINNYGITSPAYSQFEMKNNNVAKYYYYYYLMIDNTKELLHLAKNLRHSFTEDELGKINQIVPPTDEQEAIAQYLDKKCADIDLVIKDKELELDKLEEYRKSFIYEYVSGKKEVPNE